MWAKQRQDTEQTILLTTENITFDKACQSMSMEMAERNTQEFHPTTSANGFSEGTVNKIESKRNDEQAWHRCGGNHTVKTCRFKTESALNVQKIGHIVLVCRSKTSKEVKPGSTSKHGQADRGNIQNLSLYDSNNDNVNSEIRVRELFS
jgi:hypothetical protein